jgi:hypothetical protein
MNSIATGYVPQPTSILLGSLFELVETIAAPAIEANERAWLSLGLPKETVEAAKPALAAVLIPHFDAARHQYAAAVRAGLIESSMLGNRKFERALTSLEKLALGPFART